MRRAAPPASRLFYLPLDPARGRIVLRAGMMSVIPQGAWHRFHSSEGVTLMTATPFPSEHIELDVDDPRTVERKPA
jgi:hypothetical protein